MTASISGKFTSEVRYCAIIQRQEVLTNGLNQSSKKAAEDVFIKARDSFLSSLSTDERQLFTPCPSKEEFEKALGELEVMTRRTDKRNKWMKVMRNFISLLEPYFKLVDIFVSSNPHYAAIVWGSIRVVFQVLVSTFSIFLLTSLLIDILTAGRQLHHLL